jgi:hypothetical protein
MFEFLIGGAVGLFIGWLFLPCPVAVRAWWDSILHKTPPTA